MAERHPQFPIRVDPINIKKLRYIAKYNGRSANKEIDMLIRRYIDSFEKRHGEITPQDIESM